MNKPLGERLKEMTKDERIDWEHERLDEITGEHVIALDMNGWKIVSKFDRPNHDNRWPFRSFETGYDCPDWCKDQYYLERSLDE